MMGGLNRLLSKEIRSRQYLVSDESRQIGLKTNYVPRLGFQDCELCKEGAHGPLPHHHPFSQLICGYLIKRRRNRYSHSQITTYSMTIAGSAEYTHNRSVGRSP